MEKSDLKNEINTVINSSYMNLAGRGCSSSMCVATTEHSIEDAVDNVIAAVEGLTMKISNGWNNIKALHLKVEHSIALPIHESLVFEDWWAENKIFKEDIQKSMFLHSILRLLPSSKMVLSSVLIINVRK
ncbi:ribosomal L1 domain-containing protein 1-like [Anneissia japonica]|uniref:ribosomal L1 domain-containing protein 1-like n=1 Tax=Anneissia japonica TaxID=1529436 RepID=UPI0014257422|nr:ribosomal L1 domain-containing protein 1-like [Anneissia japonica]